MSSFQLQHGPPSATAEIRETAISDQVQLALTLREGRLQ